MGKILIIMGLVLVVSGLVIQYSDRLSFFGKLPGDIRIERGNFSLYLPLATSILLSILLSVVLYLINRFRN
jgi:Zn-dependent protease with chaperone function